MVLFPNCKINLGLRIVGKRTDGFHNLDTVFLPLSLKDAAEIIPCSQLKKNTTSDFELSLSGIAVPGEVGSNLCTKAWELIKADFPEIPALKMHLLKAIPPGAGLAGGSSNGAFTLQLLNQLLELNLTRQQLIEYALKLGSDCPFFIINKPCHAQGRGEILEETPIDLADYTFVLVYPRIHIPTAWAFSQLKMEGSVSTSTKEIIHQPINSWKEHLVNDFEKPVFTAHPALKKIKEQLYNDGAVYASLTGTGSCIYGIFPKKEDAPQLAFEESYIVYHLNQLA